MKVKKRGLLSVLIAGSFMMIGCSTQVPDVSVNNQDDQFEKQHAQEMQKKMEGGENNVMASATIDLLQPENPLEIVTELVEYMDGVEGFYAYPQSNPQAPGIVVIHERRGLNEHIEDMARILAMNGYSALAVDLYNGEVAEEMEQARELSSGLDNEQTAENLLAAERFLRQQSSQVASLGWCLGGAQSLNLSTASDSLDATVVYYGRLPTDQNQLAMINQPLLGIFAENDNGIPPASVETFQNTLDELGRDDYEITIYPGVGHAFANPTGGNFEQEATMDAWNKTLNFLEANLTQ